MIEWIQIHAAQMMEWIQAHAAATWWLAGLSAVAFVATLIIVPLIVVRIPADYFKHASRHRAPWVDQHVVVRGLLLAVKNVLGGLLVLVGIAMLVFPGQGLLTIAIGLMLLDFPGKYHVERWFVSRKPVLRAINWLRRRAGRIPLVVERPGGQPAQNRSA